MTDETSEAIDAVPEPRGWGITTLRVALEVVLVAVILGLLWAFFLPVTWTTQQRSGGATTNAGSETAAP